MTWKVPFTVLVFGTVLVAVCFIYLTERNRTFVSNHRRKEGRFHPDWDRTKARGVGGEDSSEEPQPLPPVRRRIRFRR